MPLSSIRLCQCAICQQKTDHPDKAIHYKINLFLSHLDEQQRRWFVALEASRLGFGGIRLMSEITGMDEKTIHRGQQELEQGLPNRPHDRVRLPGGGRPLLENSLSK
jgi:hypothetical protein